MVAGDGFGLADKVSMLTLLETNTVLPRAMGEEKAADIRRYARILQDTAVGT